MYVFLSYLEDGCCCQNVIYLKCQKCHRCLTSGTKKVSYQNITFKCLSNIKALLIHHCLYRYIIGPCHNVVASIASVSTIKESIVNFFIKKFTTELGFFYLYCLQPDSIIISCNYIIILVIGGFKYIEWLYSNYMHV